MIKLTDYKIGFACKVTMKGDMYKFRTTRISAINDLPSKNQVEIIKSRAINNLNTTKNIIKWCINNNIQLYRLSSDIIPLATYIEKFWDWSTDDDVILLCSQIKMLINVSGIRTSFHPDQFCVLSNPNNQDIFEKTAFPILNYHDKLSDLLGVNDICIHLGGGYGDKESAMNAFESNFYKLSNRLKSKIRLENDKIYNIRETLDMCHRVGTPCILDIHHHNCYPCSEPIESLIDEIKSTWGTMTPKMHISSGRDSHTDYKHADYVSQEDFDYALNLTDGKWNYILECKMKNDAVSALNL